MGKGNRKAKGRRKQLKEAFGGRKEGRKEGSQ